MLNSFFFAALPPKFFAPLFLRFAASLFDFSFFDFFLLRSRKNPPSSFAVSQQNFFSATRSKKRDCTCGFAQVGVELRFSLSHRFCPHLRKAAPDRLRFFYLLFPLRQFYRQLKNPDDLNDYRDLLLNLFTVYQFLSEYLHRLLLFFSKICKEEIKPKISLFSVLFLLGCNSNEF